MKKKAPTHTILLGRWEVLKEELDFQQKKNILIFLDILAATQWTCFPSTWQDNCKYTFCWWAAAKAPHPWETSASPALSMEPSEGQVVPARSVHWGCRRFLAKVGHSAGHLCHGAGEHNLWNQICHQREVPVTIIIFILAIKCERHNSPLNPTLPNKVMRRCLIKQATPGALKAKVFRDAALRLWIFSYRALLPLPKPSTKRCSVPGARRTKCFITAI